MKKAFLMGVFVFAATASWAIDAAPRILWIGDSHSAMTFGKVIDLQLRGAYGIENVFLYGSCGSTPLYYKNGTSTVCGYLQITPTQDPTTHGFIISEFSRPTYPTPVLETLISADTPTVLIVAEGSNMIVETEDATRDLQIDFILKTLQAHPMKCIWVGQPDMRGFTGRPMTPAQVEHVRDQIRTRIEGKCSYIDSLAFTHYPANEGDGVHYPVDLAKPWANEVFTQIQNLLKTSD